MPTIRANGLDIAYDVHGAGPPLVLLPGATSLGRSDFAAQIPLFSRAFRVFVPDARGHGRTRWDAAAGFRYDWLVDDLAAFVDAVGLETLHLVGFSMGAMTALQYAARQPERLRTLTVVGITTELDYTLEQSTPELLVFVGENDKATSTDTITITPSGTGSRIRYRAELEMHGMAKLAAPAMKLIFEKVATDTEHQMIEVLNQLAS